jgi:ornithine lipid ester-linked acyl 2-hydroxylase
MSTAKQHNLFFSFLHERDQHEKADTFYAADDLEWAKNIELNWKIIQEEVTAHLKTTNELKPYFSTVLVNSPGKWKTSGFYFWGMRVSAKACRACPETIRILSGVPNIVTAALSITEPHSEIKGHFGDTNAIYRCHLGLVIPASLPECGFRVGYEEKSWEEGKLLVFNDAAYHRGWNNTNERRIVLLFDVIKPEYADKKAWICSKVLGSILFQMISQKLGIFKRKRGPLVRFLYWINALLAWIYLHSLKRKSSWL